jgi:FtsP/CotA-like multicopper oxidase with cupredoxin domain
MNPAVDAMADPRSKLDGHLGDRTLVRILNAGMGKHAVHTHGNHMEWLTSNGQVRPVWSKDVVPLDGNGGAADVIYPFDPPPDAWPPVTESTLVQAENEGRHFAFPMHLHNEMTQTAGGGLYMFGALTDIYFHSK